MASSLRDVAGDLFAHDDFNLEEDALARRRRPPAPAVR
jgi:hypothetical protein